MNETDLLDGVRVAQTGAWLTEGYHAVSSSAWGFPTVSAICLLLLCLVLIKHKGILAAGLSVLGQLPKVLKGWWGAKAMRKERAERIRIDAKQALMDYIDDQVTAGQISTYEANDLYRFYARLHPDFKNCIEKIAGNAAIKAELKGSKDAHGNIIPMPIPDGKGAPATSLHIHAA